MVAALVARLRDELQVHGRLIVAFSGGADSALLAAVAAEVLGPRALAVTAVSASLPESERLAAAEFTREHGIRHLQVCTDEAQRPDYVLNGRDRCYHCKSALFDALQPLADLLDAPIALGTNLDDLADHRPGHRAATERGALTPLVDAGFSKQAVREAGRLLQLATADKPAAACLASRVAYGDPVTPQLLHRIEVAEQAVKSLGFGVCRVRAHAGGTVARVEVAAPDIERAAAHRQAIDSAVREAGFAFCALDLSGFRSGGMNVLLTLERTPRSTERPA